MPAKTQCVKLLLSWVLMTRVLTIWVLTPAAVAEAPKPLPHSKAAPASHRAHASPSPFLNASEGLSVISAALESRGRHSRPDCSHLVHAIYEHAGYPYSYVSSSGLYHGVPEFHRVTHPQPGDLVAWPGHVGIVVNPSQSAFFSSLGSGLGVESYAAPYWKERGERRFFRYAKTAVAAKSEKPGHRRTAHPAAPATIYHAASGSPR